MPSKNREHFIIHYNFKENQMVKIIAVTNQKGGVGKTTTSVNLAASLADSGAKVLLVDMDPQGNATMGCGVNKYEIATSVYDVLIQDANARTVAVYLEKEKFTLLPSNADVTAAEVELISMPMKEHRLRLALSPIKNDYDYILIDCPPTLNMLTLNALVAADGVLIPLQCEYYALEGLSALVDTVLQIHSSINPKLEIFGIVRTMFDQRTNLTTEVSRQLIEHFGTKLYTTTIPRNVRLAEAPSFGQSILQYDRQSKGALAYLVLASELKRKISPVSGSGLPNKPAQLEPALTEV